MITNHSGISDAATGVSGLAVLFPSVRDETRALTDGCLIRTASRVTELRANIGDA